MEGELLVRALIEAIGLPEEYVERELNGLMKKHKLNKEELTLDQLRPLIAELVQETLVDNKRALKEASNI